MQPLAEARRIPALMALNVFLYLGLAGLAEGGLPAERPAVLVLNSYHEGFMWSDNVMEGLRVGLFESEEEVQLSVEFMDTKRHPPEGVIPHLLRLYAWKYRDPPDVVIVSDNNAFDFVLEHREALFRDLPVVFCGINNFDDSLIEGHSNITGVVEKSDMAGTLRLITRVHPRAHSIVVIADATITSNQLLQEVRSLELGTGDFPPLRELIGWTWSELASELRRLPRDAVTVSLVLQRDRAGISLSESEAAQLVLESSSVPDYSLWDWAVEAGSLGGIPNSGYDQGATAAELALRILAGEPASGIPVISRRPTVPVFNFRQMERFGIERSALPRGSVVLHEPVSLYSRYRGVILSAIALVVLEGLVILALALSIAGRRRAESALEEEEERFRQLAERAHIIPWEADFKSLNCTYVGPQAVAALGYPVETWSQRGFWLDHLHEDDRAATITTLRRISREREDFELEYRMIAADGRVVWLQQITHVFRDRSGPLRLRGFLLDITERKRAEDEANQNRERLAHVTRLGTMGEMATAMAHEINQPLTAVSSYAAACQNLVRAGRTDDPDLIESLERIRSAAHRAGDVIRRIRQFVKKRESERVICDVNNLVTEVLGLARSETRMTNITIERSLGAALPRVCVDPVHIQQVVLNLVNNAVEAMLAANVPDPVITVETGAADGEGVRVSVADRGPGISPQDAERVFEPYFSTKASGMGMGLAICRSIVLAHGGRFWFESNSQGGTTFSFTVETADDQGDG